MLFVAKELISGFLLTEKHSNNRTYESWYTTLTDALNGLGCKVLYQVSDRARALIKLAQEGLGCPSVADLFHFMHDLSKSSALAIQIRYNISFFAQLFFIFISLSKHSHNLLLYHNNIHNNRVNKNSYLPLARLPQVPL